MRLLITAQTVARTDSRLGFFVPWIEELAARVEHVDVICLEKGEYSLPDNVSVRTLGKESMRLPRLIARAVYIVRFYRELFRLRENYDAVFVHMNQEYVLLAGFLWKLMGKRVYMWRNHYDGTLLTDIAVSLCTRVFCTSRYSYTARFKKTVFMPIGVNVDSIRPEIPVEQLPHSILALARLDISKRPELLLEAYALLAKEGIRFQASFVGAPSDPAYGRMLEARAEALGLSGLVTFVGGVPNTETFRYYRSHKIFVNAGRSGMLDKSMFKAIASGAVLLSSSEDLKAEVSSEFIYEDGSAEDLAKKLSYFLALSDAALREEHAKLVPLIEKNSLPVLATRLVEEMQKQG